MHVIFTLLMLAAVGFGLWLLGSLVIGWLDAAGVSWHDNDPDDYDW